ncbi:hypothetical protein [Comamonas sp. JC664]|uniref:hypothetical protein n=1 Tax=Comamonas sp. JC664 TaxID=2801917 RepID=UPI0036198B15
MADHHHHRLLAPDYSVRHYEGEQQAHSHDHVQLLYALAGRMELEVDGKAAYVDTASGVEVYRRVPPTSYLAQKGSALAVVDVADGADWAQMRRFAAAPAARLAGHPCLGLDRGPRPMWPGSAVARAAAAPRAGCAGITAAVRPIWPATGAPPQLAALAHLSAPAFSCAPGRS